MPKCDVRICEEDGRHMKWTDTTSYVKGERGKKAPTCWSWQGKRLNITVTCGHIYAPGQWVMHCYPLGIDTLKLVDAKTKEKAQYRAIRFVKRRLADMVEELDLMMKEG